MDPAALGPVLARAAAWLALLAALFVPLERVGALHRHPWRRPGTGVDILLFFAGAIVPALVLAVPLAAAAALADRLLPAGYQRAVAGLPGAARAAAALLVAEAGFYWGHRWSHELPWLWRFHAVHHAPRRLDWLVNGRVHPVDLVFTRACGLVPLGLLGLVPGPGGAAPPALAVVAGTLWGFLLHANLRWRCRPLEALVATPAFHHWHHGGPPGRNFAALLPVLDRLFGTLHLPADRWPDRYGTGSHPTPPAHDRLPITKPFV